MAGRKPKLTPKQIEELKRRRLSGESVRGLAKEYKVSPATISTLISKRTEIQKVVANKLATAEMDFEALPISEQCSVRNLADQLKGISTDLAAAAKSGSVIARRLNHIAEMQSLQVDEHGTIEENALPLKAVMMTCQVANEAGKIPLNLLAANKKAIDDFNMTDTVDIPSGLGFLYGE